MAVSALTRSPMRLQQSEAAHLHRSAPIPAARPFRKMQSGNPASRKDSGNHRLRTMPADTTAGRQADYSNVFSYLLTTQTVTIPLRCTEKTSFGCSQIIRQRIGIHQQQLLTQEVHILIGKGDTFQLSVDITYKTLLILCGIMLYEAFFLIQQIVGHIIGGKNTVVGMDTLVNQSRYGYEQLRFRQCPLQLAQILIDTGCHTETDAALYPKSPVCMFSRSSSVVFL